MLRLDPMDCPNQFVVGKDLAGPGSLAPNSRRGNKAHPAVKYFPQRDLVGSQ